MMNSFVDAKPRERAIDLHGMEKMEGFINKRNLSGDRRTDEIQNLKSFTKYRFCIFACSVNKCSEYEMIFERTAATRDFDQIDFQPSKNNLIGNKFSIYFEEPMNVNGAIITYRIEIVQKLGNVTIIVLQDCITRLTHAMHGYM
jgi:hypothetical protein